MTSITPRTERFLSALLITLFVLFSLGYATAPILEGVDEGFHLNYAFVVATTGALPPRMDTSPGSIEFFQPPLYYLAPALLIRLTGDAADFEELANTHTNPNWTPVRDKSEVGVTLKPYGELRNPFHYVHPASENLPFPSSPTARAVYLIRLYGVLLGGLAMIFCKQIFALLFPDNPLRRLLALGLITMWPNLQYQYALIGNDALEITLAIAAILLMLRILNGQDSWQVYALLGAAVGGALLSKLSALALGAPLAALLILRRHRLMNIASTGFMILAVAGWWWAYGQIVYGDPLGLVGHSVQVKVLVEGADQHLTFADYLPRMFQAYIRMWAYFGDHNAKFPAPPGISLLFYTLPVVALVAAAYQSFSLFRGGKLTLAQMGIRATILLIAFTLTTLAALYWFQSHAALGNQPRHLYHAAPMWGALGAYGLSVFVSARLGLRQLLSVIALLTFISAFSLFGGFLIAYRPVPPPLTIPNALGYHYEGAAELIGSDRSEYTAVAGGDLTLTLYWRSLAETPDGDLTVVIMGGKGSRLVNYAPPADGWFATRFWAPNLTWAETHIIPIPIDSPPGTYALLAGLIDPETRRILKSTNADGKASPWQIGTLLIEPAQ